MLSWRYVNDFSMSDMVEVTAGAGAGADFGVKTGVSGFTSASAPAVIWIQVSASEEGRK
jgi:hypothetical protein